MPTKMIWHWNSFSVTNMKKLTHIKLNRQTPCPPRSVVPVNSRARVSRICLNPARQVRTLVIAAAVPAMLNE